MYYHHFSYVRNTISFCNDILLCILYDVFVLVGLISVLRDALNNVDSLLIVFATVFSRYYSCIFSSVPVHKVDDITHVNFTDRDHLWFDPNWKNGNNNKEMQQGSSQSRESMVEDPMAVMLENNAKNTNAANIFVNKLHGLVSEYAEVNHDLELRHNGTEKNRQPPQHQQGPYATTTLLEPSNVSHTPL